MLRTRHESAALRGAYQARCTPPRCPWFEAVWRTFQSRPQNQAFDCVPENSPGLDPATVNCNWLLLPALLKYQPQCSSAAEQSFLVSLDVVFHNRVNSSYSVFPINLLALLVSPPAIRNADFINATTSLRELGNDFRLEPKPIFFKLNRFDERGFEGFVTCFHIGQIQICEHVGK